MQSYQKKVQLGLVFVFGLLITACGGGGGGGGGDPAPDTDTTPPVITLRGNSTISVPYSAAYREPGATAQDSTDGTVAVGIDGEVDTRAPGTYTVTYTATDAAGNRSQVQRTIIVEPQQVQLRVSTIGDGTYTLDTGAELDCSGRPGECLERFEIGTTVTITANPSPGQVFVEWLNCDTTSGASCTVTLTTGRTVLSTIASDAPVVLQPNVVQLTTDQIDSIVGFDAGVDKLEFPAGADLTGIVTGNVLVSNGSPANPIVFGRRVIDVSQQGSNTIVLTRKAALVEIVRSGTVIVRPQFAGAVQPAGTAIAKNPGRLAAPSRAVATSGSGIALEFNGEDEIVLFQEGPNKVSLVGGASIQPTFQAVFDFEDDGGLLPRIEAWRLYSDTTITTAVTLRVQGQPPGFSFKDDIAIGPKLSYISTAETVVPTEFLVQAKVGINARFAVSAESGLEVSLNNLQTGIQWHRDSGLSPLFDGGATEFTALNFLETLRGSALLDFAPGIDTAALVLGVAGPVLSVRGFGQANLVFDQQAECEVSLSTSAGLRFSVSGELELYFWDYSINFIGSELVLYSDTPFGCLSGPSDNGTDAQPPTDVLGVTVLNPLNPGGLSLTWSDATDNVAVAYYEIWRFNSSDSAPQPVPIAQSVTARFDDLGLLGDSEYCYAVTAVDGAGNASMLPTNSGFICGTTLPDNAPPLVPAPVLAPAASVSESAIALEWGYSGEAVTEFSIYDVTSNANPLPIGVTSDQTFTVSNLTTSQTYCFAVLAIDELGRPSESSNVECAVPADNDVTPPSQPQQVVAEPNSSSSINVSWEASMDDVAVASYKVFRDGMISQTTTATNIVESGLSASTEYCFAIAAVDAAGNESARSMPEVCATTLSLVGAYGSITIQGSDLPGQFVPITGSGPSAGAADGFLQTTWQDGSGGALAVSIADDYQGVNGADVVLMIVARQYRCSSGFAGMTGDCSGASYDRVTRTVTLSNVELIGPGGVSAIVNGALVY